MADAVSWKMNHVALSMAPEEIDGARRREIISFYEDVFSWSEYVEDAAFVEDLSRELSALVGKEVPAYEPLVLLTGKGHFVFLYGMDDPMKASPVDHFGFEVDSEAELDRILDRAKSFAQHDPDVRIVDKVVTPFDVDESLASRLPGNKVELVNCYIGYRMPFAVEVQFYRWPS